MACKRITISLTEEQYEQFKDVLPAKANISEVLADQIGMFVSATGKYGDDFILDVMCNRGGYSIQKNDSEKSPLWKNVKGKSSREKTGVESDDQESKPNKTKS
jgi:hypothetical protein